MRAEATHQTLELQYYTTKRASCFAGGKKSKFATQPTMIAPSTKLKSLLPKDGKDIQYELPEV